ncbi:sodium- and chloride-dependent taurine transporter-like [Amphiura filiformis]|uniref:sodium- and chloride-dependent taurine transporter-like n=1 Tax=Amphiura filiformis TaxID=82378 RepID=UPI003B21B0BA
MAENTKNDLRTKLVDGEGDLSPVYNVESEHLKPRETWSGKLDFILALIGFSVGFGNVWRFPYLCYKNGGGAFLIPYFICLVVAGIAILILELAIGQYMQSGGITAWNLVPLFKGTGHASIVILILLNTYYNIILAWSLYYLFMSFTAKLPWSHCDNDWNTENCLHPDIQYNNNKSACAPTPGATDIPTTTEPMMTTEVTLCINGTLRNASSYTPASVEFWERKILQIHLSEGIDDPGGLNWQMVLSLGLAWVIVYLCIFKGVKSSGKVVYFTAPFPYVLLTILICFSVTLDNAVDGLSYYLTPDWSRLADSQVWLDATTQIFFSYSLGLGTMMALGSYNKPDRNFFRDGIIFACVNSATSLYAGIAVFSVLGFMAGKQGINIDQVAASGPGLVFIVYPEGVTQMPIPTLWAILFFLMLLLLGIDSQFVGVEGLVTAFVDLFPHIFRKGYRREMFAAAVCVTCYVAGLSMCTYGGMYLFQIFDYYAASGTSLLWIAFFECVIIGWVYGANRFAEDIKTMNGRKLGRWLQICWVVSGPGFTAAIFFYTLIEYEPLTYNDTYVYPAWGYALGWGMSVASMVQIPLYALYKLLVTNGTFPERWKLLTTPKNVPIYQKDFKDHDTSFHENVAIIQSNPDERSYGTLPPNDAKSETGTSSA